MAGQGERPLTLAELRAKSGARGRREAEVRPPQMGLLFAEGVAAAESAGAMGGRNPDATGAQDEALAGIAAREEPSEGSLVAGPIAMPARVFPATPAVRQSVPGGGGEERARQEPTAERRVWSVRELVGDVRTRVERGYAAVWVEGEISNCRAAGSGHMYLTLKDGEAQLAVALFRRQAQMLRFRPENGMAVLLRGRLSVYEGRGELQLIAETMEPRGAGALLVQFEQLKARLKAEGLFEAARKRALPAFPRTVGVVTSTAGAALHDVVTVVRRRNARLNLLIFPALVQGAGCAASVMAGLRWFARRPGMVDLVVLARGGGSAEDLCGFNDEALARAIAASPVPVVSAIGHETDFSIADFVADLRAATPSAAAELITEAQHRVEERLHRLEQRLARASRMRLLEARERLGRVSAERVMERVQRGLDLRQQRVDDLQRRLERANERETRGRRERMEGLARRLERQNPGWRLGWDRQRLHRLEQRMRHAAPMLVGRQRSRLERAGARLEALSPVAVLERGYALVYNLPGAEGGELSLVSSSTETAPGRRIVARLGRGSLTAEVLETNSP